MEIHACVTHHRRYTYKHHSNCRASAWSTIQPIAVAQTGPQDLSDVQATNEVEWSRSEKYSLRNLVVMTGVINPMLHTLNAMITHVCLRLQTYSCN